jgi:hypothetical protein
MWQAILSNLSGIFSKVVDAVKYVTTFFYIRRSTRIENEKDALEVSNSVKNQQIDIASDAPVDPSDLRERMQSGDF